jgi:hypothetical protein
MSADADDSEEVSTPGGNVSSVASAPESSLSRAAIAWIRRQRDKLRRRPIRHDGPRIQLDFTGKDATAAATGAAVAHVLSRPDSIRQRAQGAATISSAFAAALVIAVLGHFTSGAETWNDSTVVLVFLATVLWAVTAGMFVYAVAFIAPATSPVDLDKLVEDY